jgi:hypothetical protein
VDFVEPKAITNYNVLISCRLHNQLYRLLRQEASIVLFVEILAIGL